MKLDRLTVACELKALGTADDTHVFEGYGSVFGGLDSYGDTIVKGAFKQTLKDWKAKGKLPKMLLQHGGGFMGGADDMVPIGKWDEMREDDTGLYVKGRLFDIPTDRAKATYVAMKEGELDGLSIGFQAKKSKIDEVTGKRTLTEISLWEISPVTFGADSAALITAVKAADMTERQFEEFLRDAGFPIAAAKTIVASGYRKLRDAAPDAAEIKTTDLIAALNARRELFTGETR